MLDRIALLFIGSNFSFKQHKFSRSIFYTPCVKLIGMLTSTSFLFDSAPQQFLLHSIHLLNTLSQFLAHFSDGVQTR